MTTTPTFPTLVPSSRQFTQGDWPIARYTSQNGSEVRILYGDREVGQSLSLGYENITDAEAETFITHYQAMQGTFTTFALPQPITDNAGAGWSGTATVFNAGQGSQYRYAGPPVLTSVYPGVSSITIKLITVGNPE